MFKTSLLLLVVFAQIEGAFCCVSIPNAEAGESQSIVQSDMGVKSSSHDLTPFNDTVCTVCRHDHAYVVGFDAARPRFDFEANLLSAYFQSFLPEIKPDLPWQPPRSI